MIISQEMLKNAKSGETFNGVILIKSYTLDKTKGGKDYIQGTAQSGKVVKFKSWSGSTALECLKLEDYSGVVAHVTGTYDDYGGEISLVVATVQAVSGYTPDMFFEVKYNADAYFDALVATTSSSVSQQGMDVLNMMLFDNAPLRDRFKVEFAAATHHDNCKSGLLAHTYKMTCLLKWVIGTYKELFYEDGTTEVSQSKVDLLVTGCILHDIGKTLEMNFGVYQPNSPVSHRFFGAEMLAQNKEFIVSKFDEKWYYDLVSILLQHHGEFGDPCRTLAAFIIHKIDLFESTMTGLVQEINTKTITDSTGSRIWYDKVPLAL